MEGINRRLVKDNADPMDQVHAIVTRKDLEKARPLQPHRIKPTECYNKRKVRNRDAGNYEIIDKRDIHYLDPGDI